MIGKLQCVVLDCLYVRELAQFYQALLGGVVNQPDPRWAVGDDFATLHTGSGLVFAFQRVKNYQAPQWPDSAHPQQFHLDLDVPDLDRAQQQVLGLGGTLLHLDTRGWRVFADPAGHPFCLLRSRQGSALLPDGLVSGRRNGRGHREANERSTSPGQRIAATRPG